MAAHSCSANCVNLLLADLLELDYAVHGNKCVV